MSSDSQKVETRWELMERERKRESRRQQEMTRMRRCDGGEE
jgi:hypothetical protein